VASQKDTSLKGFSTQAQVLPKKNKSRIYSLMPIVPTGGIIKKQARIKP